MKIKNIKVKFSKLFYGRKGFSLIEMTLVIIIMGVLFAGGMLIRGWQIVDSARIQATQQQIISYSQAIILFKAQHGRIPGQGDSKKAWADLYQNGFIRKPDKGGANNPYPSSSLGGGFFFSVREEEVWIILKEQQADKKNEAFLTTNQIKQIVTNLPMKTDWQDSKSTKNDEKHTLGIFVCSS